jgi:two-component system nitrate/nitrite response regulator NarL
MSQPAPITVLVADDHPLVLRGISDLLQAEPDLRIAAECKNGLDAVEQIRALGPAIAVLDLSMPGLSGLEVLKQVRSEQLSCQVIILTASISDAKLLDAVAAGVNGILLKDAAPDLLVQCLREVADGHRWLPQDLLDAALARETARKGAGRNFTDSLTPREREVMLLVADGLSNKEVGRKLNLSDGTVKIHLHNIYQKVGLGNRTALAAAAVSQRNELDRAARGDD